VEQFEAAGAYPRVEQFKAAGAYPRVEQFKAAGAYPRVTYSSEGFRPMRCLSKSDLSMSDYLSTLKPAAAAAANKIIKYKGPRLNEGSPRQSHGLGLGG
jgi:hypothetical protein